MPGVTRTTAGPRPVETVSAAAARRIALAAQQLRGGAPPARQGAATLLRAVDRLGVLQLDSVNVVERAHRLPLFSRWGPYPVDRLEGLAWCAPERAEQRTLVEAWAHEASLVPVDLYPAVGLRGRHWSQALAGRLEAEHPGLLDEVVAVVRDAGPSTAGQIEQRLADAARGRPGWWEWSATKQACEALFAQGVLATAYRKGFQRHYDLVERVLPARILDRPVPAQDEACRTLVDRAGRALGIATVKDLADYYRMNVAQARAATADLVEDGVLVPVSVQGWKDPAYLYAGAARPRSVDGAALLAPFDPLIWDRARTERLFDFHYRIEIYTPAARRRFGYYVYPLLLDDRLVGRFDLKADRPTGRLLVQASWQEESGVRRPDDAARAVVELRSLAGWLGLGDLDVQPRGNWAGEIAAAART